MSAPHVRALRDGYSLELDSFVICSVRNIDVAPRVKTFLSIGKAF